MTEFDESEEILNIRADVARVFTNWVEKNCEDYEKMLEKDRHDQKWAKHVLELHDCCDKRNREWEEFYNDNPPPTSYDVRHRNLHLQQMRMEYEESKWFRVAWGESLKNVTGNIAYIERKIAFLRSLDVKVTKRG
jgi:hypothetical protein